MAKNNDIVKKLLMLKVFWVSQRRKNDAKENQRATTRDCPYGWLLFCMWYD